MIILAVYPDTVQSLNKFTQDFLLEKKISISQSNINLITKKCQGNKLFLKKELEKIELYCKNNKSISETEILKLTNLIENYSISELVDNCLAKNKRQISNIFADKKYEAIFDNINLSDFLVCSKVNFLQSDLGKEMKNLTSFSDIKVLVKKASGIKCNHCWKISEGTCERKNCPVI